MASVSDNTIQQQHGRDVRAGEGFFYRQQQLRIMASGPDPPSARGFPPLLWE